jgi:hypothetical protein
MHSRWFSWMLVVLDGVVCSENEAEAVLSFTCAVAAAGVLHHPCHRPRPALRRPLSVRIGAFFFAGSTHEAPPTPNAVKRIRR